jgi:hypothetical protein
MTFSDDGNFTPTLESNGEKMARGVLDVREEIQNTYENSSNILVYGHEFGGFNEMVEFDAFCACKDLIMDTQQAIETHVAKGFDKNPFIAYIEFWGLMQAVFIQQDAIFELCDVLKVTKPKPLPQKWAELRDMRNLTTGHPANQSHGQPATRRCVTSCEQKTHDEITLAVVSNGKTEFEKLALRGLLSDFEVEAASVLEDILAAMKPMFPPAP